MSEPINSTSICMESTPFICSKFEIKSICSKINSNEKIMRNEKNQEEVSYENEKLTDIIVRDSLGQLQLNYGTITKLNLSKNYLKKCDFSFIKLLTNLEFLDLSNNEIEALELNNEISNNNDKKLDLNLSGNKLAKFPTNFLNKLKNLTRLDLSYNEIDDNINDVTIPLIEELNLSHNILATLTFSDKFSKLKILKLNNNQLKDLNVSNLENLKNLYVEKNKISDCSLINNKKLEELYLNDNDLNKINLNSNSTSLKYIYIKGNNLKEVDFGFLDKFPNLELIDFSSNKIKKIINIKNLTTNLSDNKKLKLINLSDNKIDSTEFNMVDIDEKIKNNIHRIDLRNNLNNLSEKKYFLKFFTNNSCKFDGKCDDPRDKNKVKSLLNINNDDEIINSGKFYYFRKNDYFYYFRFYFLYVNFKNKKCSFHEYDQIFEDFEQKKSSILDILLQIGIPSHDMCNLKKQIHSYKKIKSKESISIIEFNFFSPKSILEFCKRNDLNLFEIFFPQNTLNKNENENLEFLRTNDQLNFLEKIDFFECFKTSYENKNPNIIIKLFALYQYYLKLSKEKDPKIVKNQFFKKECTSLEKINELKKVNEFFEQKKSYSEVFNSDCFQKTSDHFWKQRLLYRLSPERIYWFLIVLFFFTLIFYSLYSFQNWVWLQCNGLKWFMGFILFFANIIDIIRIKFLLSFKNLIKLLLELIDLVLFCIFIFDYCENRILHSISILLHYTVFLIKLDILSKYVRVLEKIIKESGLFLIIFSFLILGFIFAFKKLGNKNVISMKNESDWKVLMMEEFLKLTIMSIGNLEEENFPIDENLFVFLIYWGFIIMMTVIFINIFSGVSVNEIRIMFEKTKADQAIEKWQYSLLLDTIKYYLNYLKKKIKN